jgi:type I restriction enzyme S subunit
MEVRPGYKQTEVGEIPQDWFVAQLGQLATFITSGSRGWAQFYSNNGALFIRSQNIGGGRLCFDDVQHVSPPAGAEGNRTRVERNDLLITITGNSVGNVALIEELFGEAYISQHVGLVRLREPTTGAYINRYLSPKAPGNSQIAGSQSGQSKPGLNLQNLRDFRIAFPPTLQEINAISDVLQDVDALLDGLTRLIAKKRDLKQATMQQLLTGQTRLPGFDGAWEEKYLGELGEITGAGVDKKIRSNEIPVRLLNYMDVYKRDFLRANDFWHEVTAKPDQARRCAVHRGDIFFTPTSEIREDIGHSAVAIEDAPDVVYSYHVVRLRLSKEWDVNFRAYVFKTKHFMDQASTQSEGSGTRYVITLPKFRSMTVRYPTDIAEQAAIGKILSDMDAELAVLEARLTKTLALKQAMMSELLTGKTRLPTS